MQLLLIRHLWGMHGSWEDIFPRLRPIGYGGVETSVPDIEHQERFQHLLRSHDLQFIAQIYTDGASVGAHIDSFRRGLDRALTLSPLFVDCHGGSDTFDESDACHFYEQALCAEEDAGIAVTHETHRGRILFTPWGTDRMLTRFPSMKLCCDYSHWACVCQRLLDDQREVFERCANHAMHVHARVGYEHGPQVSDPRAPEFRNHVERHEEWWRMIWASQQRRGIQISTLTPEYGPPPYLQVSPYTQQPVADLETICDWQALREKINFENFIREI